MAEFSRGVRKFWNNVVKYKFGEVNGQPMDMRLVYDEKSGFHREKLPACEVHHLLPGSYAEVVGQNPNAQIGLPVSRLGHRGRSTLPYDPSYSFHPDMEKAAEQYKSGDKNAFKKAIIRHKAEAMVGNFPPGYDPDVAGVLEEEMLAAAVEYVAVTGDKKPISSKIMRKKHWSDDLF